MILDSEIVKALNVENEDSGIFFVVNNAILNLKLCLNHKEKLMRGMNFDECIPQIIVKRSGPGLCRLYMETYREGSMEMIHEEIITDDQAIDLCKEMRSHNVERFDQ